MDLDPVTLSRIQFAFVISFHIIFPAFTIGLAAWLATIEGVRLFTGNLLYRRIFDFWLKIFAVSFGMGVVTGIVMAFQFGTNWGVLAERTGSIQGPLLGYEAFTAFMLEASFFGVMLLGRDRVSPGFFFFACCMVSLGTMFSSFWILANNSWMQVPVGHEIVDGKIIPADWREIVLGPVMMVRWPHMLLAAFLTTAMCIAATGAWYVLRGVHRSEARVMLHWGLGLAAVLIPVQLFFGHLTGLYVLEHQPAKFAAIEARWQTQQPASEVLIAWPDAASQRNRFALEIPKLGSFIASGNWTAREIGLDTFPVEDRPPVLIPFFGFRIMVGMGLIMLGISWLGNLLRWRGRLETTRWFLWGTFLSFPTGFVAILSGWYTAEVGRQPWVVYGLLRTIDSKDAIKLAIAIVATLSAIALGLLTASAKTSFDDAEADLRGSAAEILLLDRVLAHYGPETQEARGLLRDFIVSQLDRPSSENTADELGIEAVQDKVRSLAPETAAQRFLQPRALEVSGKIAETHWLLVESGSEIPPLPFLAIMVLWLTLLFAVFGLLAPGNTTVMCTIIVCALAVAGAVFLMLDMAHPHLGIIQASDAPLRSALEHLGRP